MLERKIPLEVAKLMFCIRIMAIRRRLGLCLITKFAYSTDVISMSDDVFDKIAGVDLWIVEALRADPHSSHSHFEQTFAWIERVKPARAVLTHLDLAQITKNCWRYAQIVPSQVLTACNFNCEFNQNITLCVRAKY